MELQEYSKYTFPLAVAIVLSGMYEDDLDNAEDVVYTGQGGHNLTGDKRQIRDQVMERGNLALKVCYTRLWDFQGKPALTSLEMPVIDLFNSFFVCTLYLYYGLYGRHLNLCEELVTA